MKVLKLINKKIVIGFLIGLLCVNLGIIYLLKPKAASQNIGVAYTVEELKKYDGTDPNLPIYLSFNGDVYDVTVGKEYYDTNGVYHYLAGKDSTAELNFAGGSIIKVKYKVIGHLVK